MPAAVFFMMLIISLSLSLSTAALLQGAQASVDQSAAALMVETLPDLRSNERLLEFQQGREVRGERTLEWALPASEVVEDMQAEVMLYDVLPDEAIDAVQIEVCATTDCPEYLIEWIRWDKSFSFQALEGLGDFSSDSNLGDGCVDLVLLGIQRCAVRSSQTSFPSGLQGLESEDFYDRWRVQTALAGYHYLVRLRVFGDEPVMMRWSGEGFDGSEMPLPGHIQEHSSQASAGSSSAQNQEQRQLRGGLQPGLSFVHYAHEVDSK